MLLRLVSVGGSEMENPEAANVGKSRARRGEEKRAEVSFPPRATTN
jgi:hypothetical protein